MAGAIPGALHVLILIEDVEGIIIGAEQQKLKNDLFAKRAEAKVKVKEEIPQTPIAAKKTASLVMGLVCCWLRLRRHNSSVTETKMHVCALLNKQVILLEQYLSISKGRSQSLPSGKRKVQVMTPEQHMISLVVKVALDCIKGSDCKIGKERREEKLIREDLGLTGDLAGYIERGYSQEGKVKPSEVRQIEAWL